MSAKKTDEATAETTAEVTAETTATAAKTTAKKTAKATESTYTIDELASAASTGKLLGRTVSKVLAKTALKLDGKKAYTKSEAVKIIDEFSKREVK